MRCISVDGLTSCRGSMPSIREGPIRRFIFEVRLSGPFEWRFSLNFRLIIGILEWRHDSQIANTLLLRNPRGTCGCGCKNDWLHIRQHVGILGGCQVPPYFSSLVVTFLLLPTCVALLQKNFLTLSLDSLCWQFVTRRQEEEEEEEEEEGKHLNHFNEQERGKWFL